MTQLIQEQASMTQQQLHRAWQRIVARAWADENFKGRLISDPINVLSENGFKAGEGARIAVANNADTWVFHIPTLHEGGAPDQSDTWMFHLPPKPVTLAKMDKGDGEQYLPIRCCCCCWY